MSVQSISEMVKSIQCQHLHMTGILLVVHPQNFQETNVFRVTLGAEHVPVTDVNNVSESRKSNEKEVQTDNFRTHDGTRDLEMLALASENRNLQEEYAKLVLKMENNSREKQETQHTKKAVSVSIVESFMQQDFQYYTGFSYERFQDILKFLIPNNTPFKYSKNMTCLTSISIQDQLLFVLMKLRQDFDFKHLSHLFNISQQDCSTLFTDWINYMFYRLGSLCIWPHRDVIIENMPTQYKQDFPNSMVIIEIKIQRLSALQTQSQCYSDYKSGTTLKAVVGVDPRGSVIFSSMLFSRSISDKKITLKSGFYEVLKSFLKIGKLKPGDGVMADKGFKIVEELGDLWNIQF